MNLLRELLARSTADGSRTNALNHLQWMIAAFLVVLMVLATLAIAQWILILVAILLVILFAAYLATHFYFAVKNPDALRSERFSIQKMAIERGIIGDSQSGTREYLRGEIDDSFVLGTGNEESKP